jgi:uncharacterized protein (DUF58 family)
MFKTLFLNNRFFVAIGLVVIMLVLSFSLTALLLFSQVLLGFVVLLLLLDIALLYRQIAFEGRRETPQKLSNGDDNELFIHLQNKYVFPTSVIIHDELPFQLQKRDVAFTAELKPKAEITLSYKVRPVKRGDYHFGGINVMVSSPIGFASRRYVFSQDKVVPVYPSYIQLRKYDLRAIHNNLVDLGIKKIRRIGHNQEFEQVNDYVFGDDVRTINWKATARRNSLMVNHYQDEKSQQIYSLIDKGRVMKMPFEGMSLMDYAINASLVISNVAIRKDDKAGLITFNHKAGTSLKAAKTGNQMQHIMEVLFNQKTSYKESDYEAMFLQVRKHITQRSLLMLYTNFETVTSLERQMPYLRKLATQHLLVVIFFENTELHELTKQPAHDVETVYQKGLAEKLEMDKRRIVSELRTHGIYSVLTSPQNLTINTLNKYLELKARGLI